MTTILTDSANGWKFKVRDDKSILATHLPSRTVFTFPCCDIDALGKGLTSKDYQFKNCVIECTEDAFCLKRVLRPGCKRTKMVTEGVWMDKSLIDLLLQRLNPSEITTAEGYQIDAGLMVETIIAFIVLRLVCCNGFMNNEDGESASEPDCTSSYKRHVTHNTPVNIDQVRNALYTSCGVPPFFSTRLSDVYMIFIEETDLSLYPSFALDICETLTPLRVMELINTRVLKTGCDDAGTCFLRSRLELFRECWCFYNIY